MNYTLNLLSPSPQPIYVAQDKYKLEVVHEARAHLYGRWSFSTRKSRGRCHPVTSNQEISQEQAMYIGKFLLKGMYTQNQQMT